MLTVRAAASLLARAASPEDSRPLLRQLGFTLPPLPVDASLRAALGITDLVTAARLHAAPRSHRAFVARLAPTADPREATRAIARALERHAPDGAWLACLIGERTVTLAAWTRDDAGVRVAALHCDRDAVTDSDADTLRALATTADLADGSHARWLDILRRDAISGRFYRAFERCVQTLAHTAAGAATARERHELALLCASRLLFLAFLEAKGWLDGDRGFLLRTATRALTDGGRLHDRWLRPLLFGTLNTPVARRARAARAFGRVPFLNGGLFAPTPLERRRRRVVFSDDALLALLGDLLDRFRFTAREDSHAWSEAAVDPEMLGRAFESLMGARERRGSGSYYTPPTLVDRIVTDALAALPADALTSGRVRVIDPACGSGAFLVHVLERLANARIAGGDARAVHLVRRDVLGASIFGVDRNPLAAWLCELRLWLSVVIDCDVADPLDVPPLPNLDHHVRVGDALAAGDFRRTPTSGRRLAALRDRYVRASGARKRTLADALAREERARAVADSARGIEVLVADRRALLAQLRTRDLFGERATPAAADRARLRTLRDQLREARAEHRRLTHGGALPFRFAAHFADVGLAGGFDLVVGNPPWVRPHELPRAERGRLRVEFRALRDAPWRAGAARAGAGVGFAAQADLAAAFVERGTALLRPGGVLALLLPAKLWRTLAGGGVRRHLAEETTLLAVHDLSHAPAMFDAAVYPSIIIARRDPTTAPTTPVAVHIAARDSAFAFTVPANALPLGGDIAAPWVLLPPAARAAFERLRRIGPALGDAGLGRPTLGVKCGLNEAFLVHATEHDDDLATIASEHGEATSDARATRGRTGRAATIERTSLRPALAGAAVGAPARDALRIVWTHDRDGRPLATLPPRTARWLARWRPRLEARRDARHRLPWWSLFRTDAANLAAPRLVWADFGRSLRTVVLDAGDPTVPLNTCYVLRTPSLEDAYALDALLGSPIAHAWLDAIAEPARGGWRRYLGWTVAALPVPAEWPVARAQLAPLGRRRASGDPPSPMEHAAAVAGAYGITLREVQPLLAWSAAHD